MNITKEQAKERAFKVIKKLGVARMSDIEGEFFVLIPLTGDKTFAIENKPFKWDMLKPILEELKKEGKVFTDTENGRTVYLDFNPNPKRK